MSEKTILVVGRAGQVAHALATIPSLTGQRVVARGRPGLDVLDNS